MSTALVAASIGWISCPPAHRSEPDGFTIILISCWSRRSGQRPISFKRRRRGKEASDRKDLGDRAGLRRDPCGSAGSDRHHATPLQDEEAVLELLRPGYGDPLELGLHSVGPWIRCLDQDRCTENAWALSSAQPFLEEHLQGCRDDGHYATQEGSHLCSHRTAPRQRHEADAREAEPGTIRNITGSGVASSVRCSIGRMTSVIRPSSRGAERRTGPAPIPGQGGRRVLCRRRCS